MHYQPGVQHAATRSVVAPHNDCNNNVMFVHLEKVILTIPSPSLSHTDAFS